MHEKALAVIISTCNRPFLLKSLVSQLKPQLKDNDTILIVNDGDPGSVSQFARENIYTIDHCKDYYALASGRNMGMKTAINMGYDWGLILDDDIEISSSLLEEHRSAWSDKKTAYAGKITENNSKKDIRKFWWNGEGSFVVKWGGCNVSFHLPSLMKAGGYNEDFDGAWGWEDNELYQRLKEKDWNIDFLEEAEIENLKAPPSGNYRRGNSKNREKVSREATYRDG